MPLSLKALGGKLVYLLYGVSAFSNTSDMLIVISISGSYAKNEFMQIGISLTGFKFTSLKGNMHTIEKLKKEASGS